METDSNNNLTAGVTQKLESLILSDIKDRVLNFQDSNPNLDVYAEFGDSTKLNSKSLRNWLKKGTLPYCRSLEAFYTQFCKMNFDEIPQFVKDYFTEKHYKARTEVEYINLDKFFLAERTRHIIYRSVSNGRKLTVSNIFLTYGSDGIEAIDALKEKELLAEKDSVLITTNIKPEPTNELYSIYASSHIKSFPIEKHVDGTLKNDNKTALTDSFFSIDPVDQFELRSEIEAAIYGVLNKYENKALNEKSETMDFQLTCISSLIDYKSEGLQ